MLIYARLNWPNLCGSPPVTTNPQSQANAPRLRHDGLQGGDARLSMSALPADLQSLRRLKWRQQRRRSITHRLTIMDLDKLFGRETSPVITSLTATSTASWPALRSPPRKSQEIKETHHEERTLSNRNPARTRDTGE